MEPKWFAKSKTVWGVVGMALPTLLPVLGVSFGADDSALVSNTADSVFQLISALLAIWGRVTASSPMKLTP